MRIIIKPSRFLARSDKHDTVIATHCSHCFGRGCFVLDVQSLVGAFFLAKLYIREKRKEMKTRVAGGGINIGVDIIEVCSVPPHTRRNFACNFFYNWVCATVDGYCWYACVYGPSAYSETSLVIIDFPD